MENGNLREIPGLPENTGDGGGNSQASAIQHEDAALKTAFQYFSDELLPYFGIRKKVVRIAPSELVHIQDSGYNLRIIFRED